MIFLVSSGKMMFLFVENMILFFRRKMKMIFYKKSKKNKKKNKQKTHGNMIYYSNVQKRWSFQKNCTGILSFLYHEERWHFFFLKI